MTCGTLAGALLFASHASADSASQIVNRIESAFDLVMKDESASSSAQSILTRRAQERRGAEVAVLPYAAVEPESAAFQAVFAAFPATGALGRLPSTGAIVLARLPRPRPEAPAVTGSIGAEPIASEPESVFFGRFAGSFAGGGEVKQDARSSANQVQCNLTGRPSATGISISGKCGVSFFSREVRADIRYDQARGVYTGTYVGASAGTAKLWGKRRGDEVVFAIRWPKPVNGDTKATMTIRNSGNGTLAISVVDEVHPGGPKAEVTRLALSQL